MNVTEYLTCWAASYKNDLINNIMPFWMKYGLDQVNGGVYTCVNRDGSLMDTTKSVWFQGRFGFIAALPIIIWIKILNGCRLQKVVSTLLNGTASIRTAVCILK